MQAKTKAISRGRSKTSKNDLLDRADEGEQGAHQQGLGKSIADRLAGAQGLPRRFSDPPRSEAPPMLGRKRLGKPHQRPEGQGRSIESETDEDVPPRRHREHSLAEGGSEDRDDHEHDHHQRHDPGHPRAVVAVADDRDDQHPRCRRGHALQHPRPKQQGEAPG
jgi:hypothetical protein